ncbi:hypothetical protein [Pseudonocardia kunmingensis]|uniref:Uncharacterized protein n=1 Tax=Pseudonocardia kunmingensis TaxID=630975 RepID=A0A543DY76_9PSEU|nr:hypothetical protein [Pseudonocardia kunmingensis]TQM14292.1 hypothetical protein FB558_1054 [Pseudonocardia kunmingensis]
MHEHEVSGRPVQDRRAGERRHAPRRRASGPRPVRPGVVPVRVRPAEAERPRVRRSAPLRHPVPGVRVLVRRPLAVVPAGGVRLRVRRVLAGLAVALGAAVAVAGLGLLADAVAAQRSAEVPARVAPVEQTVTGGSLTPVLPGLGQVLRVTSG